MRTHADFLRAFRELAAEFPQLTVQHFPVVTKSWAPGWPDLVIVGPGGLLWREVKTARGRCAPAQWHWAGLLTAAGQDWAVWGPADYPDNAREQLRRLAKV